MKQKVCTSKWSYSLSALLISILVSECVYAAESALSVPRLNDAITVDGTDLDPAWKTAASINLGYLLGKDNSPKSNTTVRLLFNEDALYLFFNCQEPNPEKIVARSTEHDGKLWLDDCVEIYLSPYTNHPNHFYQLLVNSRGAIFDQQCNQGQDASWSSQAQAVGKIGKDAWTVEVKIPFSSFKEGPIVGDLWRGNFARENIVNGELSTWAYITGHFFGRSEVFKPLELKGISKNPKVAAQAKSTVDKLSRQMLETLKEYKEKSATIQKSPAGQKFNERLAFYKKNLTTSEDSAQLDAWIVSATKELPDLLSQAVLENQTAKGKTIVWAISPMMKFRQDQWPAFDDVPQYQLHAARGEAESVQFIVGATKEKLTDIEVKVSPLMGPEGSKIVPEVHLMGYVPIKSPSGVGFKTPGNYPDPLMPLKPFSLSKGQNQAIWYTAWVPREALAGDYKGTVTVSDGSGNSASKVINVQLKVYPVTLPKQSNLKTSMYFYGGIDNYHDLGLKYRFTSPPSVAVDPPITKDDQGNLKADWSKFDKTVQEWFDKGITIVRVDNLLPMRKPPQVPDAKDKNVTTLLTLLDKHLQEKGWTDRVCFYLFDEPSPEQYDLVKRHFEYFKQFGPNLTNMLVGYQPNFYKLAGLVNLWVPHMNQFDVKFFDERQKAGDHVWMYQCGTQFSSCPDIMRIDWVGTSHRAVGWWLWRYNCEGYLYWCVNHWVKDPWKDPAGACPPYIGEGMLFYPDPNKKGAGYPSIRIELTRDGFEDYDLLYMLREKYTNNKNQTLADQAKTLLTTTKIIPNPKTFLEKPYLYEKYHQELLELLSAR